jgi:peptidoglycan hydrolase-like protein with peptidoglycan-binding domain
VKRVASATVVQPTLSRGSAGPSVLALERRLAELRYALPRVDATYGHDTVEAVLAFQKVHGLPRTGSVEPWLWRRLARASVPRARRGGDYIEVDKSRQVMFVVRGGEVVKAVHVSTGATGNTPLGTWQVYRKVPGWDWVLWYPLYFLRGFAIHGYPSVPAYPASHGCVRVPMWIAPQIFDQHRFGTKVSVFA